MPSPLITQYISPDSPEFKEFDLFLQENFAQANSKNLCVQCWCLCNRYQLDAFINLAQQCGRYKDDKQLKKRLFEKITAHTDFLHSTSAVLTSCTNSYRQEGNQAINQIINSGVGLYQLNPEEMMMPNPRIIANLIPNFNASNSNSDNVNINNFNNQDLGGNFIRDQKNQNTKSLLKKRPFQNSTINSSQEYYSDYDDDQNYNGSNSKSLKRLYNIVLKNQRDNESTFDQIEKEQQLLRNMCTQIKSSLDMVLDSLINSSSQQIQINSSIIKNNRLDKAKVQN
ncbi:UNKNOWN [Stylonychia lemnae]|uniref:Uncharacterized protein n=1 Tax=Stylonychia lemnae TaxID=5949 RepID=A0A077ZMF1_STYLE|nr:UNKNOWN [Stylonychia lemnae]|eukprot:CDW71138.1 UNKNOWN [Stylonychia lemnae]